MGRSVERYSQEASRCRALAETALCPIARARFAEIAETYEDMADVAAGVAEFGHGSGSDTN